MPNPARILYDILAPWALIPANQSLAQARSDHLWHTHRRGAACLLQIEQFCRGMAATGQDMDAYLESLDSWTAALFGFPGSWSQAANGNQTLIDERDLRLLRSLATQMASTGYPSLLTEATVQSLVTTLDAVERMIRDATFIDETAKRYLLGLVIEAIRVLKDIETFGEATLRSALLELSGALVGYADINDDSTNEEASGFRAAAKQIAVQLVTGASMLAIDAAAHKAGITT